MKIGDLIITEDCCKVGLILEGVLNWFDSKEFNETEGPPNLFYIYWIDREEGIRYRAWHRITEPIVANSTVYESEKKI